MIKAEVLKKDDKVSEVNVTIEGSRNDLFVEVSSILESFDKRPDLAMILVIAMDKLIQKAKEEN